MTPSETRMVSNVPRLAVPLVILALALAGCHSPSSPDVPTGPLPYIRWSGNPTSEQMAWTDTNWERMAACVGLDPHVLVLFPIAIMDEPMYCWSGKDKREVLAAGCASPDRIRIGREWAFENGGAVLTELMHVALWRKGQSVEYDNPYFTTCRWW